MGRAGALVVVGLLAGCGGGGRGTPPASVPLERVPPSPADPPVTAPPTTAPPLGAPPAGATPGIPAPRAGATPAGPAPIPFTRIVYAAPVDADGAPNGMVAVTATLTGTCEPGSDVIAGVTVHRCFSGNSVYDPCWTAVPAGGDGPAASVICVAEPWSTTGVAIRAGGLASEVVAGPTDLDHPWAVQLTTGQRCVAVQGAHGSYQGHFLDYGCDGPGGIELLRGVDRTSRLWTFPAASQDDRAAGRISTVSVAIAWYAGPAPASHLRSWPPTVICSRIGPPAVGFASR